MYPGLYTELGKLNIDGGLFINLPPVEWGKDKRENIKQGTCKIESTDAVFSGGLDRSSEEASVMGVERRVQVIQLILL